MAEKKMETMIDKIEKLIVGGQKEVLDKINSLSVDMGTLKADVSTLKADVSTLKTDVSTLKKDMIVVKNKIETLDKTVSTNFSMLSYDIKQASDKLDAHIRVPHAA